MSNENTPSNAGKEHNPDGLTKEQVGEGWRLLTKEEYGQGFEHEIRGNIERWTGSSWQPFNSGWFKFVTYRRRATPPTQSQEGETPETDRHDFDESCGYDVPWSDFCRELERRLTAAQRENDRLRSEVARIRSLAMICAAPLLHHAYKTCDRPCDTTLCPSCAAKALRAATEEGKRG